jgi:predicted ATPase
LYTPPAELLILDDLEMGLHHSHFFPLLDMIFFHAQQHKTQVFISTHSDDVVKAWLNLHHRQEQLKKEAKKDKSGKKRITLFDSTAWNLVRLATDSNHLRLQSFQHDSLYVLRHNHSEFRN